jgi:hypothetical protein
MENIIHYFQVMEFGKTPENTTLCGLSAKTEGLYGTNNLNLVTCEKCKEIFYETANYKYLVLKGHENTKLGMLISTNTNSIGGGVSLQITSALPDIWNEKEGWIKWGIRGYSAKRIELLKNDILTRIYYLKLMERTFEFSYE